MEFENNSSEMAVIGFENSLTGNQVSEITIGSLGNITEQGNADDHSTLEKLYDFFVETWLESLPVDAPASVRLRRERLARMLSIDNHLSTRVVYPKLVPLEQSLRPGDSAGLHIANQSVQMMAESQNDLTLAMDSPGTSGVDSRASSRSRASSFSQRIFLENFTSVTHTSSGNSDLETLLNDWNINASVDDYQWRPLESIQQQALEGIRRSRSRSTTGSRRGRATSALGSAGVQNVPLTDRFTTTQPVTRSEVSSILAAPLSQLASSQIFPASQVYRGRFGDSKKVKKRRTEGF